MSVSERIHLAERKLDRLDAHLARLIQSNANINMLVLSGRIASQIPESFAAHAYNSLQNDLVHYEVGRVVSIWDDVDYEKDSFPTIFAILDGASVCRQVYRNQLRDEIRTSHGPYIIGAENLDSDVVRNLERQSATWSRERNRQNLVKYTKRARRLFYSTISSKRLESLRRYRDQLVAHNIDWELKDQETTNTQPLDPVKYGQSGKLLRISCSLSFALNIAFRSTDFPYKDRFEISKKNTDALWGGARFEGIR